MDSNMISGIVRAVAPAIIAYLVGAGTLPAGDYAELVAATAAFGAAIWSVFSNRKPTAA